MSIKHGTGEGEEGPTVVECTDDIASAPERIEDRVTVIARVRVIAICILIGAVPIIIVEVF